MKRKKIVAGNWKMNLILTEAVELVNNILRVTTPGNQVEKIIFPPFPFLKAMADLLVEESLYSVGAQNCSEYSRGAFTGEVAADMIRSAGSSYVLIGHSERRQYFNETPQQLQSKIQQALVNDLDVVFCIGEQLTERREKKHFDTVSLQLKEVLGQFPEEQTTRLVIAYEPVWAIGTGETASPAQAQEMHAFIRKELSAIFSKEKAEGMAILYGGSCNAQNARELFAGEDVDGGLIGGASLKAEDFCKIMDSF